MISVQERLIDRSRPVKDTIKKNNLSLFSNSNKKSMTKEESQVLALKNDCALFSRLYSAFKCREGNLDEFL